MTLNCLIFEEKKIELHKVPVIENDRNIDKGFIQFRDMQFDPPEKRG